MPPVNNNYSGLPPLYDGNALYHGNGEWTNYEPPPAGYIYGEPIFGKVPRLISTSTAPAATGPKAEQSSQAAASSGRAAGTVPRHPAILQHREEAASSSTGGSYPISSQYLLSEKTREAFNKARRDTRTIIRHLTSFAEAHPDEAIRCSLEDIATLPSGEDGKGIWRFPAVSAWLESPENPYRPLKLDGNSQGPSALKNFRTLLGHKDVNYFELEISETTRKILGDQRVSDNTKKLRSALLHLAHFVENYNDVDIRCTLANIVDRPAGNGVWGNPSVDAWLKSKDNPHRPSADGGNGNGPAAVRSLRRDYGKKDYQ